MRRYLLPILFTAVLSVAVYAPALNNGFVYDDPLTVVNNAMIKDLSNLPKLFQKDYFALSGETSYRPVVTVTYFLDYALYGLRPWGFHLTNILLHAINAGILYMLFISILRQSGIEVQRPERLFSNPPLIASLLFSVHPILSEAVNAVSFREDLLIFPFYAGTILLYIRLRSRPSPAIYFLSCVTYSFALFSKEMAVSLPLVICCYELIYRERGKGLHQAALNIWNIGYLAATIAYIYLRFSYLLSPEEAGFGFPEWSIMERLATFPWLFMNYSRLVLFPVSLSVDYMTPPLGPAVSASFLMSFAFFAAVVATAILLVKRDKGISFGIFFFILTLLPVYNLLPIGHPVPLAERFLYLPAAGVAIALVLAVSKLRVKPLYLWALIPLFGVYMSATAVRSLAWKDNYTLWSDTVKKLPRNPFARYALGLAYQRLEKFEKAKEHFQASLRLRPEDPAAGDIYINLGDIYNKLGQFDDAVAAYRTAARLKPEDPTPNYNLGVAYAAHRRFDEAAQEFIIALRLAPGFVEARHNLGMAYMERGILDKAREEFEMTLKLKPDFILSRKAIESIESRARQK